MNGKLLVWLGAGVLSLSCAKTEPVVGVVTARLPARVGNEAPEITLRTADGKDLRLSSFYGGSTLIAFTQAKDGSCAIPTGELASAVADTRGRKIALVEFIKPGLSCEHPAACCITQEMEQERVVTICDKGELARARFQVAADATVFVLDHDGKIRATGALEELSDLVRTAKSLEADYQKEMEERHKG